MGNSFKSNCNSSSETSRISTSSDKFSMQSDSAVIEMRNDTELWRGADSHREIPHFSSDRSVAFASGWGEHTLLQGYQITKLLVLISTLFSLC